MDVRTVRIVQWGFILALLGTIALVSSAWLGPVLGVIGLILSVMGLNHVRSQGGVMFNMAIIGIVFGCLDIALLWIAPGVFHTIWG